MTNIYKSGIILSALTGQLLLGSTAVEAAITVAQTNCEVKVTTDTSGDGGYTASNSPISSYKFEVITPSGAREVYTQESREYTFTPTRTGTYTITVSTATNTGGRRVNAVGQVSNDARAYTIVETATYRVNQIGRWQFAQISQRTLAERSNYGYYMAVGPDNKVAYAGSDGWVKFLYYTPNGWAHAWASSTNNPAEKITGAITVEQATGNVLYRAADKRVHAYYYDNGWQHAALSGSNSTSENVAEGPYAIATSNPGGIVFAGADKWVHMYTYNSATGSFDHQYLTQTFNANEQVAGVVAASTVDGKIFYKGMDNRMHCYYRENGQWAHTTLVQNWDGSENVDGQIAVYGNSAVYYAGADGWIHRYYYANNQWMHERLTTSFDPLEKHSGSVSVNDLEQVFYRNNSDVRVYYRNNGVWENSYMVQDWNNAAENASVATQVVAGRNGQLFYSDENGYMNSYYWSNCYAFRPTVLAQNSEKKVATEEVNLFPNPAETQATLTYQAQEMTPLLLEVTTLTGQQVLSKKLVAKQGVNKFDLDLTGILSGMHVVTLRTATKVVYRSKLSVTK